MSLLDINDPVFAAPANFKTQKHGWITAPNPMKLGCCVKRHSTTICKSFSPNIHLNSQQRYLMFNRLTIVFLQIFTYLEFDSCKNVPKTFGQGAAKDQESYACSQKYSFGTFHS